MEGFRVYKYFLALKLHFGSDKYNVFEKRGAVKASRDKFLLRNDRYIFEKLGKKFDQDKDVIQYMASNFIYGNPNFVYSGSDADDAYIEWQRRRQSITKILSDDVDTIIRYAEDNDQTGYDVFYCTKTCMPGIINLYMAKKICIESICILNDSLHFIPDWKQSNNAMLLLEDDIRRIEKSKGFVKYNVERVQPIITNLGKELVLNQNE